MALTSAIKTAQSAEISAFVTDGDGRALYRFDKDTAKPPATNCSGACATAWPPVLVSAAASVVATGVDQALVGTVQRSDGATQLTIAGWPAYRYSKDAAAGEVKGQGAGGTWWAFTPEGKKAAASAAGKVAPVTLAVMKVGKLGAIVTDRSGMTLYRFDKDTAKPSASNCTGECAVKWPPLLVPAGAEVVAEGIAVGTVERADGTRQVTVGGWPVYLFSGDKVPCDTAGQGVGGTWFALNAGGAKVGG
ncbi:hypothetical protein [Actinokineospora sp. NBRC 105648]|uniref:hypothetical protein n=1 Tax=Actinokineospora sp. NBRC 105648 TaxID=3032206 RepID=UPI00255590ED|nr:hypothetical protein [Actinokineospora sp. NBRC 105648]